MEFKKTGLTLEQFKKEQPFQYEMATIRAKIYRKDWKTDLTFKDAIKTALLISRIDVI